MVRGKLVICPDLEGLSREAARRLLEALAEQRITRTPFRIALSGGSTPRRLYELLASESIRSRIPWVRLHFFWGDERMVPHDSPQSNFRLAQDALLRHVPVPRQNIHPVPTQTSPEEAAQRYEQELRAHFGRFGTPVFDLVLLGLGADGHTASLFPGAAALAEKHRPVVAHRTGLKGSDRVTLTLPVLNSSRRVFFLVSGESKAGALRAALTAGGPLPAQQVSPDRGDLVWFVDAQAASRLDRLRVETVAVREAQG